jgi:hypothetical protein
MFSNLRSNMRILVKSCWVKQLLSEKLIGQLQAATT